MSAELRRVLIPSRDSKFQIRLKVSPLASRPTTAKLDVGHPVVSDSGDAALSRLAAQEPTPLAAEAILGNKQNMALRTYISAMQDPTSTPQVRGERQSMCLKIVRMMTCCASAWLLAEISGASRILRLHPNGAVR